MSEPDSLEAALRVALDAVDVVVCIRGQSEMCPCCRTRASAEGRASIPALAVAVREWLKYWMPAPMPTKGAEARWERGWNEALADVARKLGLS